MIDKIKFNLLIAMHLIVGIALIPMELISIPYYLITKAITGQQPKYLIEIYIISVGWKMLGYLSQKKGLEAVSAITKVGLQTWKENAIKSKSV